MDVTRHRKKSAGIRPSAPPRVAVVVLNHNRKEDTLACLSSLRRADYPNLEVAVVDNGSTDGSVDTLRLAYPEVPVLETGRNLGLGHGYNLGLAFAREKEAPFALLLNEDTQVGRECLSALVHAAETHPAAGLLGPTVYHANQPDLVWSAGGRIDWQRGRARKLGRGEIDRGQFGEEPRKVDFLCGCALFVRLEALAKVGPLDPRYFSYYDEVEWCVRFLRAGYEVLHVPAAKVYHNVQPRIRAERILYYKARNRLLFLEATGARLRAWWYTLLMDYPRLVLRTRRPDPARSHPRVLLAAVRDYFLGRLGPAPLPD